MVKVKEDLTGKTYGHLTVLYQGEDYIGSNNSHVAQWWCKCDCENPELVLIRGVYLKNGHTQSCGCVFKQSCISNGKKNKGYNKYDLLGEYGIGYTSNTNKPFLFDLEDYDKIKNYCWYENARGYIVAHEDDNEHTIRLSRLVMDCNEKGLDVDHIKHDLCDNRKQKLRICEHQKNTFNSALSTRNTSGTTGVYYDKHRNKWVAEIRVNYKKIFLGRFSEFEEAARIRKEAEEKYFGKYSYSNSMAASLDDTKDDIMGKEWAVSNG